MRGAKRRTQPRVRRGLFLTAARVVLVAALALVVGAIHAWGAPAAKGVSLSPSAIQINPKRPSVVYASGLGDDTEPGGVYKSTDAGRTWSLADAGLSNPASPMGSEHLRVDALALDPRSPNVLYAGTGLGVFKTTDGAQTWKLASTGIDFGGDPQGHRLAEGSTWALAIDPLHTSTVYACNGAGVWKTDNGGASWKNMLAGHFVVNVAIDPRRPKTVYASGMKGFQNKETRSSIFKTVTGGGSWRATGPPGLWDNFFGHPIVVDRGAPGIVYAGGSRGLFASTNQGRTWTKLVSSPAPGRIDTIALDPVRRNVLYVGGWASGVMRSKDRGQTWSKLRLGMRDVTTVAIDPTRPQTIYVGGDGISKSSDGGATWQRLTS